MWPVFNRLQKDDYTTEAFGGRDMILFCLVAPGPVRAGHHPVFLMRARGEEPTGFQIQQ
jgi:hypothetical protein